MSRPESEETTLAQQWYVGYPDRTVGPLSPQELLALARSGQLAPEDRVSLDQQKWTKASKIKGLTFSTVPHPFATASAGDLNKSARPPEVTAAYDESGQVASPLPADEEIRQEIEATLRRKDEVIPGYEILGVLGHGGMGVVYRARQKKLDRAVAVKTVLLSQATKPSAVARFEKEAVTVAKLQHPHIVAAYDFGHHGGRLFFVMELVQGESLETRLDREGNLAEPLAWNLARQAAAGLAHAASQGIIHRDIKPGNLLLVAPPTGFGLPPGVPMVKLTDFGLALLDTGSATSERLTVAGTVVGTPIYMSPEQFRSGTIDHRADIYSLGATVLHMLTGESPFQGESIWEVMTQKMEASLPMLTKWEGTLSPETMALLRAMLAVDPNQRIGTYEELLQQIDALPFLQDASPRKSSFSRPEPPTAASEKVAPPVRAKPRRTKVWVAVGAVGVFLIVAAVWFLFSTPAGKPLVETKGHHEDLYNIETRAGWVIKNGKWDPAKDEENTTVLSGTSTGSGRGVYRRTIAPLPHFRIIMGVDLRKAKAVQIHFGLVSEDGPRHVLQITQEGAVLGRATGDDGALEQIGTVKVPYPPPSDKKTPYQNVTLERIGNRWWVQFNNVELGPVSMLGKEELPEFRLAVEEGPAYFNEVQYDQLVLTK